MANIFLTIIIVIISSHACLGTEIRKPDPKEIELNENGHPILKVKLHAPGRPGMARTFRFLLDTGCTHCLIDTSIAESFFRGDSDLREMGDASGNALRVPLVVLKRVEVAGMTRDGISALRLDIKRGLMGRFQDEPIDGVLGMSFLQGTRFVLDLSRKRMEWWGKGWPTGTVLTVRYTAHKLPMVAVKTGGKDGDCILDTGMVGGLSLPWPLHPGDKGKPSVTVGLGGTAVTGETLEGQDVWAGDGVWKKVPVEFQGLGGLIGLDVWSAGPACFDFVNDRLTLTTSRETGLAICRKPRPQLPILWDRTAKPPKMSVHLVKAGSPMEGAGFLPGDEILRVGRLELRQLTRRKIQDLVEAGQPQWWVLQRKGGQVTLRFPYPLEPAP